MGQECTETYGGYILPDCTQCLSDDFKVSQLIHGGELVIVTNAALTDNDDKMLSMIVEMNQKNIAGLVINVGQISPMLTEYCNDNELPLFELSYDLHLIDLSQIVAKAWWKKKATQTR